MLCFRINVDHFDFQFQRRFSVLDFKCIRQLQNTLFFHRFCPVIKGIKLRLRQHHLSFFVTLPDWYKLLVNTTNIHQTAQRHIKIDRRLMFPDHNDFSICFIRKIILQIHPHKINQSRHCFLLFCSPLAFKNPFLFFV